LLDQLIDYWRDLMVLHCAGSAAQDLSVAPRHRATLTRQASALSLDSILAGLDILNTTRARLRGSVHARVLLEMALVRLGRLAHLVALAQVSHWLNDAERAVPLNPAAPRTVRQAAPGPEEDLKKKPPPPAEAQETERPTLSEHSLPTLWQEMLTQVGGMLAGHLEKAGLPAITGPNTLVLRFPPRYNHEYAFCQEPERYQRIEAVLRTLVGQQFQLRIETAGSGAAPEPDNVAAGATSPPRSRQQRAEAVPEPLLRRAIDVLGAQVVHMDEGFGVVPATAVERPPDTEET
jgi:DNA polymerase-3 subunit gamma/tau